MVVQVILNILLALIVYIVWVKLRRPPKDDPRLSRGLQLLQAKISVLEDLSDKTEVQVEQLHALMEKKIKQVQKVLSDADFKMQEISVSLNKTKEVAQIFQEEIPHDEIVRRQNTVKYVKAAKMANSGSSVEEISEVIDLPVSELELIAKLNKDNLVFDDESLPEWAKEVEQMEHQEESSVESDFSQALSTSHEDYSSLKKLGEEFRKACDDYDIESKKIEEPSQIVETMKSVSQRVSTVSHGLADSLASKVQKSIDSLGTGIEKLEEQAKKHNPIHLSKEKNDEKPLEKKEEVLEEVSPMDNTVEALRKMQKNRRLTLQQDSNSSMAANTDKRVSLTIDPKLNEKSVDINKTLG